MRLVFVAVALGIGFCCSAIAGEKSVIELLAACDQAAANPFDNTRPANVAGVSPEKDRPRERDQCLRTGRESCAERCSDCDAARPSL